MSASLLPTRPCGAPILAGALQAQPWRPLQPCARWGGRTQTPSLTSPCTSWLQAWQLREGHLDTWEGTFSSKAQGPRPHRHISRTRRQAAGGRARLPWHRHAISVCSGSPLT